MSEIIYKGSDINKDFKNKILDLVKKAKLKPAIASPDTTFITDFEFTPESGPTEKIIVHKDYEETCKLLWELYQIISITEGKKEELFRIPDVPIPTELRTIKTASITSYPKTTFFITAVDAKRLAAKKNQYKEIGIEFPEELYQLSRDISVPSRHYDQSAIAYEEELEKYYASKNHPIEYNLNAGYKKRSPLPHEYVKYSADGKPTVSKEPRPSYETHDIELQEEALENEGVLTRGGGRGLKNGVKSTITGVRKCGEKLKPYVDGSKKAIVFKRLLLAILLITCLTIGVLPALTTNLGAFIGKAIVPTAIVGGLAAYKMYFRGAGTKLFTRIRNALRNLRNGKGKNQKLPPNALYEVIEKIRKDIINKEEEKCKELEKEMAELDKKIADAQAKGLTDFVAKFTREKAELQAEHNQRIKEIQKWELKISEIQKPFSDVMIPDQEMTEEVTKSR